jgi:hypothetical protein
MRALILFFFLLPIFFQVKCQVLANDTIPGFVNEIKSVSKSTLKENSLLYSGRQYLRFSRNVSGTPFFLSEKPIAGTVLYDGVLFDSVPIYYDINIDKLIVDNYYQNNQIQLISEKVKYFILSGHKFVRTDVAGFPIGFMELVYEGVKSRVFIKRQKRLPITSNPGEERMQYKEQVLYYVEINRQLYAAQSERMLLNTLKGKKQQVQDFLKGAELSFKSDPKQLLCTVMAFYDTLKE